MKDMTPKEAALEYALMILYSVLPSEGATNLMGQLKNLTTNPAATEQAKASFEKANTIYESFDATLPRQIMMVETADLAKCREFRDCLLAVSENMNEQKYTATIDGWDRPREIRVLCDGRIAFQLTVCESDCSGCNRRKLSALSVFRQSGIDGEVARGSHGYLWANLPSLAEGTDLKEHVEKSLLVTVTSLS